MKSISLFALVVVLLFGCTGTVTKHPNKLDTFPLAIFWVRNTVTGVKSGPFLDSAILQVTSRYVLKDSVKETGGWKTDSAYWARLSDDTLRDAKRQPIFDSTHKPKWHYSYYMVPDSLIQPITRKH